MSQGDLDMSKEACERGMLHKRRAAYCIPVACHDDTDTSVRAYGLEPLPVAMCHRQRLGAVDDPRQMRLLRGAGQPLPHLELHQGEGDDGICARTISRFCVKRD